MAVEDPRIGFLYSKCHHSPFVTVFILPYLLHQRTFSAISHRHALRAILRRAASSAAEWAFPFDFQMLIQSFAINLLQTVLYFATFFTSIERSAHRFQTRFERCSAAQLPSVVNGRSSISKMLIQSLANKFASRLSLHFAIVLNWLYYMIGRGRVGVKGKLWICAGRKTLGLCGKRLEVEGNSCRNSKNQAVYETKSR